MEILDHRINNYLDDLIPERDDILQEMEAIARQNNFPIVGPQVGQVLMQYAKLTNARRIFECGSGYGYSAMWFGRATGGSCQIFCTDGDPDNKVKAIKYFKEAGIDNKITFMVGDALTQFTTVDGEFDIIYNDVDKHGYPDVYHAAIPRLRQGGLLITDNTLWSGRMIEQQPPDDNTKGVIEYNRLAFNDDRVISMILPIRDGVCVSLKL